MQNLAPVLKMEELLVRIGVFVRLHVELGNKPDVVKNADIRKHLR